MISGFPSRCKWNTSLFWDVTQRRVVLSYRRFGITYRSHVKQFKKNEFFLNCFTHEGRTDSLSRNIGNYQFTLCNIPEERRSKLNSYIKQSVSLCIIKKIHFHKEYSTVNEFYLCKFWGSRSGCVLLVVTPCNFISWSSFWRIILPPTSGFNRSKVNSETVYSVFLIKAGTYIMNVAPKFLEYMWTPAVEAKEDRIWLSCRPLP